MDPNKLIEKWYLEFIEAVTENIMHAKDRDPYDRTYAYGRSSGIIRCILDLALKTDYPGYTELSNELWAVVGQF